MSRLVGCVDDAVPRSDQLVVGAGVVRPFLALAEGIKVVGKLAYWLRVLGHTGEKATGLGFGPRIRLAD